MDYLEALHEVDSDGLPRVPAEIPDKDISVQLSKAWYRDICPRLSDVVFAKEELQGAQHAKHL